MSILELPITRPPEPGSLDPEVALVLLRRFFKSGQRLLDPFGYPPIFEEAARELGIKVVSTDLRTGVDARELPFPDRFFDGCVAHPPYWDARRYSDDPRDLSNAPRYVDYIDGMRQIIGEITRVVRPGGRLLIVVGDRRKGGSLYPIHADILNLARFYDWTPIDILILRGVLLAIRIPGYLKPGSKPPVIAHQYILVFDKQGDEA